MFLTSSIVASIFTETHCLWPHWVSGDSRQSCHSSQTKTRTDDVQHQECDGTLMYIFHLIPVPFIPMQFPARNQRFYFPPGLKVRSEVSLPKAGGGTEEALVQVATNLTCH